MSTPPTHPRIPYGEADFTYKCTPPTHPRIPYGEAAWRCHSTNRPSGAWRCQASGLDRPRRFGNRPSSSAGTDIGQHPTGEQSRYVTLRFNFSMVNDKLETLEREFETYCMIELRGRLRRHPDLFPEAAVRDILEPPSIAT